MNARVYKISVYSTWDVWLCCYHNLLRLISRTLQKSVVKTSWANMNNKLLATIAHNHVAAELSEPERGGADFDRFVNPTSIMGEDYAPPFSEFSDLPTALSAAGGLHFSPKGDRAKHVIKLYVCCGCTSQWNQNFLKSQSLNWILR